MRPVKRRLDATVVGLICLPLVISLPGIARAQGSYGYYDPSAHDTVNQQREWWLQHGGATMGPLTPENRAWANSLDQMPSGLMSPEQARQFALQGIPGLNQPSPRVPYSSAPYGNAPYGYAPGYAPRSPSQRYPTAPMNDPRRSQPTPQQVRLAIQRLTSSQLLQLVGRLPTQQLAVLAPNLSSSQVLFLLPRLTSKAVHYFTPGLSVSQILQVGPKLSTTQLDRLSQNLSTQQVQQLSQLMKAAQREQEAEDDRDNGADADDENDERPTRHDNHRYTPDGDDVFRNAYGE